MLSHGNRENGNHIERSRFIKSFYLLGKILWSLNRNIPIYYIINNTTIPLYSVSVLTQDLKIPASAYRHSMTMLTQHCINRQSAEKHWRWRHKKNISNTHAEKTNQYDRETELEKRIQHHQHSNKNKRPEFSQQQ